jgi:hypothetical protein
MVVVRYYYIEREVLREISFWYCKIFNCVQRSSLAAGCTGRGEKERRRNNIFYLRTQTRTVCFTLINHKHGYVDVALERG